MSEMEQHDIIRRIRELHAGQIGQLETIKGTVTRTSIVRPELLHGTFQCTVCKEIYPDVAQQYAYTTVGIRVACASHRVASSLHESSL